LNPSFILKNVLSLLAMSLVAIAFIQFFRLKKQEPERFAILLESSSRADEVATKLTAVSWVVGVILLFAPRAYTGFAAAVFFPVLIAIIVIEHRASRHAGVGRAFRMRLLKIKAAGFTGVVLCVAVWLMDSH
jgi:hypothetical protein